jgi:putative NADH-flavin reductase
VVLGDVRNADAMSRALAGHDAVLSALGPPGPGRNSITSDSAGATIAAMQSAGTDRLLVVGVAALFPDIGMFGHLLRNTLLRNIADDSAEMERIVKASGHNWMIVRPPRLTNGPRREHYGVADDRLPNGAGGNATISRADVAHFMLDEVEHPGHIRRLVGIAYTRRASP